MSQSCMVLGALAKFTDTLSQRVTFTGWHSLEVSWLTGLCSLDLGGAMCRFKGVLL